MNNLPPQVTGCQALILRLQLYTVVQHKADSVVHVFTDILKQMPLRHGGSAQYIIMCFDSEAQ